MTNYYPEKPQLPYFRTHVDMADVEAYIKGFAATAPVQIAAYVMFRNESGNGKSGVNNNYCGIQGDNARWPEKFDSKIIGFCTHNENMTGNNRVFLCFSDFTASVDFLIDRIEARGLFVGGYASKIAKMHINNSRDWAIAYFREWVTGSPHANPSQDFVDSMRSMYSQGAAKFNIV